MSLQTVSGLSSDEAARVEALRASGLLDAESGGAFAPLVDLAARLLSAPVAYVCLVGADRVIFKASIGLEQSEMPRDWSVTEHAVAAGGLMVIEDTAADPRTRDHPLVVGGGIRAYLGTVLRLPGGHVAGALTILDRRPRTFSAEEIATIVDLGRMAEALLKAQQQSVALAETADDARRAHEAGALVTRYLEQAEQVGKIGHWWLDGDNRLHFSKQTYALYELPAETPVDVDHALSFYEPDDGVRARALMVEAFKVCGDFDYEATMYTANGVRRRIRALGHARPDSQGRPCIFGVVQDISDESAQRDQLRWAATHDPLTGILNRRAFYEEGAVRAADPERKLFCALIDLDHLKLINDIFGHAAGDHALRTAAERMAEAFPDALVARIGGDEFGMLVDGEEEAVKARLDTLVESLRQPRDSAFGVLTLGATIGLSRVRADRSLVAAEQRADAALYHGKQSERGSVVRNRLAIERRATARMEQSARLRDSLHDGSVRTFFQPIVDLREGHVVGAEALIRLCHGTEVVPAEQFALGLGDSRLAARVFDRVMTDTVAMLESCPGLEAISVNVAPSDLMATGFADALFDRLRNAGIGADRLVIEITESTLLLGEQARVRTVLERLRMAGVGIALDDFGTGYSSLSHVSDFPITRLKIDKRFVHRMASHPRERAVTLAIIHLARQLGLELVAEGIEDDTSRAVLASAGCAMGQGFFWSPAIDDLPAFLAAHPRAGVPARKPFEPKLVGSGEG
ncbi:GGDEF domain-containing protein [Sphingomonas sp. ASV193]|uniref:putative bifunctional diguanylate cyclase/phosphodiesterase n=1 Tax=Sphingomonas sp. ASV193 TaxID=3144405 RepID=UPI0032E8A40C